MSFRPVFIAVVIGFALIIAAFLPFAPLLFPNLVVLGLIGLWALRTHAPIRAQDTPI